MTVTKYDSSATVLAEKIEFLVLRNNMMKGKGYWKADRSLSAWTPLQKILGGIDVTIFFCRKAFIFFVLRLRGSNFYKTFGTGYMLEEEKSLKL